MQITDEQLREACNRLGLNPLGTIEAELPDDMQISEEQAAEGECLENDRCYDFATSGEWVPEPGPGGFAIGHPSPGWAWLRGLVDHAGTTLESETLDLFNSDAVEAFFKEQAVMRAALLSWDEALIAVADIGVNENSIDSVEYAVSSMAVRTKFSEVAYDLLHYVGFGVCREVFTGPLNLQKGQQ